jgi:hypothetical protein
MSKLESPQVDEPIERVVPITQPDEGEQTSSVGVKRRPFVLDKTRGGGKGNLPLMLIAFGVLLVFCIGMIVFLSTKGTLKKRTAGGAAKPNLGQVAGTYAPGDLVPSDKVKPSPDEAKKGLDDADIERTKSPQVGHAKTQTAKPLNQVPPFKEPDTTPKGQWAPPPYGTQGEQQQERKEEEALSKPSLVFTAHNRATSRQRAGTVAEPIDNLGLASGYHVAARLEAMATTAVHAPVTAIIEYNYERDGRILIPAGSRAVGKIVGADPSGLMNISFSSIQFAGGETVPIEAIATDINLQALKGKVTGKQAGKSLLVRSLSGLGATVAMVVGAPNANSAFSEDDLIRMRVADNIGNAGDQQVMQMMTTQHIVVSVPAGTEIYIIFERSQANSAEGGGKTVNVPQDGPTALKTKP